MSTQLDYASVSAIIRPTKAARITGWLLTLLPMPLLLMGAFMMLTRAHDVTEGFTKAGYSESALPFIGLALLASVILFVIPQTAVLGALLLTAYLGGAVNHHVRAHEIVQMFFPILFAIVLWIALLCREPRLRTLLPLRRPS